MQIKYITAFVATLMLGGALAAPVADADVNLLNIPHQDIVLTTS